MISPLESARRTLSSRLPSDSVVPPGSRPGLRTDPSPISVGYCLYLFPSIYSVDPYLPTPTPRFVSILDLGPRSSAFSSPGVPGPLRSSA